MKPTTNLGWRAWNSIASKLHPPLPMSSRDSVRLLALLNVSFKLQLDQHHPTALFDQENYTATHLHSILKNPLFANKSSMRNARRGEGSISRIQDLLQRPMESFREQISDGTATIQTARFCLQAQYNNCLASPGDTLSTSLKTSGAGITITDWLWASGLEQSDNVLDHRNFVGLLMAFLVSEQRHDYVLAWMQRTLQQEKSRGFSKGDSPMYHKLLMQFIKAEITVGQGLNSATTLFATVVDSSRRAGVHVPLAHSALNTVSWFLLDELSQLERSEKLQINTFDPLIDVIKRFSKPGSYALALKDLHLERRPSPDSALLYFQRLTSNYISKASSKRRAHLVLTGLRTAELCLATGREADAIIMMEFLQDNFQNEVGSHAGTSSKSSTKHGTTQAERQSLHLLDTLVTA